MGPWLSIYLSLTEPTFVDASKRSRSAHAPERSSRAACTNATLDRIARRIEVATRLAVVNTDGELGHDRAVD
jgi:hypothetical protein